MPWGSAHRSLEGHREGTGGVDNRQKARFSTVVMEKSQPFCSTHMVKFNARVLPRRNRNFLLKCARGSLQGAGGRVEGMGGDMEGTAGRAQAPMAQQELDPPQIPPGFEPMRRATVPQSVRVDGLREVRGLPSGPADAMHHACRDRACPGGTGKEPRPRLLLLPRVAYQREECRREPTIPIVLAFAVPHPQDHARAVDIRALQRAKMFQSCGSDIL